MPAQLFPADYDLSKLPEAEVRVANKFRQNLSADWMIVPHVTIAVKGKDFEIDLVLISPRYGVLLVEVKGGQVTMKNGEWRSYGNKLDDPVEQVMTAKHNLAKRLKKRGVDLRGFFMQHVLAFPDNADFPAEGAGPDCERRMVFTQKELDRPLDAIARLELGSGPVPKDRIISLLKALRPDIPDIRVNGDFVESTVDEIDEATAQSLRIVEELDENLRVLVHGPAGTGKTYLAQRWVDRALRRGEATLFLCFNRFLGQDLLAKRPLTLEGRDNPPDYIVGSFHAVVRQLLDDKAPPIPPNADGAFWNGTFLEAFTANLDSIPVRFDTLVIDEGQDMSSQWLDALTRLLADPASGRILMVADNKQAIYNSEWTPPREWTSLPLTVNLRNSRKIGAAVQRVGGGKPRQFGVAGPSVTFHSTTGTREARKRIHQAINRAHNEFDIPLARIMVITRHRELRDDLRADPLSTDGLESINLVPWSEREEGSVICETIHATKGLEREAVILVNLDAEPDLATTYIGASRAIAFLAVVGSPSLGAQLGLEKS
jgi:Nuclease-related domain/AAA domain